MSTVKRAKRARRFAQIDCSVFREKQLSWSAMGMISFLQEKPDYWQVNTKHLINVTEGTAKHLKREGVLNVLKELKEAGFIHYQSSSRGGGTYTVYDHPDDNPYHKPKSANPTSANPTSANPTPLDHINNIDHNKKRLINCDSSKNLKRKKTPLPDDFEITSVMATWYEQQGFTLKIHDAHQSWRQFILDGKYMFPDWVDAWYNGMVLVNENQKYSITAISTVSKEIALTPEQEHQKQQQKKIQEKIRLVKQSIAEKNRDITTFGERQAQAMTQGNCRMAEINESLVESAKGALQDLQAEYLSLKAELEELEKVAA